MSEQTTIERAARIIAEAVVHGTTDDPALEAARALDDVGLLVGQPRRVEPSPAAVALLAECRRAKDAAYTAGVEMAGMPGAPTVTASRGEVTFVVHPQSVAEWEQWKEALGVADAWAASTGTSMIVRCMYGGVRARLVGHGVPALYRAERQVASSGGS